MTKTNYFEEFFKSAQFSVIVCACCEEHSVEYANPSARVLLNPSLSAKNLKSMSSDSLLSDYFTFKNKNYFSHLFDSLTTYGSLKLSGVTLISILNEEIIVSIMANTAELDGKQYAIICIFPQEEGEQYSSSDITMPLVYHAAFGELDIDKAINKVLAIAGDAVHVSRSYIFEPTGPGLCANTYEWCAPEVEPVIHTLQDLKNEDYGYDLIVSGGLYVTDDIRDLPQSDFEILEAQGVKALAIIPLVSSGEPIGYIGFDDCENYRAWTDDEIQMLNHISNVLISLIERRKSAETASRSFEMLQTISDNSDNVIYVTDINTYDVVFVNNRLVDALGGTASDYIGKKCWSVFQVDSGGPCEVCPINRMVADDGTILLDEYTWEFQNTLNGNWYLAKDSIVKWIDGKDVHMESATDISNQKKQEEQLLYYASIDAMTRTFNREWGYKAISSMIGDVQSENNDSGRKLSLCFIDIDDLKTTNDTYGHQAGDNLIISTVGAIKNSIRKTDLICRWGGDEFVILVECGSDAAEMLMKRAQGKLEEINELGKFPYMLDFSYGIIEITKGSDMTLDSVIPDADKLMYEQKMSKRK